MSDGKRYTDFHALFANECEEIGLHAILERRLLARTR